MRRLLLTLTCAALLLTGALPAAAQNDPCMAQGGVWNPDTDTCEISATIEITHHYPVVVADFPTADAQIAQFFVNERTRYLNNLAEYGFTPSPGPLVQEIDYEVIAHTEDVTTFVFTVYEFSGGAHGNTVIHTFTYDLAQDEAIYLQDLFQPGVDYLNVLAPLVRDDLTAQLGDMTDQDWITQGTDPTEPFNYRSWALTNDALVIYFDPYQVAAYAAGPQTVSIPLADLSDVLAESFSGG